MIRTTARTCRTAYLTPEPGRGALARLATAA